MLLVRKMLQAQLSVGPSTCSRILYIITLKILPPDTKTDVYSYVCCFHMYVDLLKTRPSFHNH